VPATGGTFAITCGGEEIWERKRDGGFPGTSATSPRSSLKVESSSCAIQAARRSQPHWVQ
jgi:predicted Rdx family selenoprotein